MFRDRDFVIFGGLQSNSGHTDTAGAIESVVYALSGSP